MAHWAIPWHWNRTRHQKKAESSRMRNIPIQSAGCPQAALSWLLPPHPQAGWRFQCALRTTTPTSQGPDTGDTGGLSPQGFVFARGRLLLMLSSLPSDPTPLHPVRSRRRSLSGRETVWITGTDSASSDARPAGCSVFSQKEV